VRNIGIDYTTCVERHISVKMGKDLTLEDVTTLHLSNYRCEGEKTFNYCADPRRIVESDGHMGGKRITDVLYEEGVEKNPNFAGRAEIPWELFVEWKRPLIIQRQRLDIFTPLNTRSLDV